MVEGVTWLQKVQYLLNEISDLYEILNLRSKDSNWPQIFFMKIRSKMQANKSKKSR